MTTGGFSGSSTVHLPFAWPIFPIHDNPSQQMDFSTLQPSVLRRLCQFYFLFMLMVIMPQSGEKDLLPSFLHIFLRRKREGTLSSAGSSSSVGSSSVVSSSSGGCSGVHLPCFFPSLPVHDSPSQHFESSILHFSVLQRLCQCPLPLMRIDAAPSFGDETYCLFSCTRLFGEKGSAQPPQRAPHPQEALLAQWALVAPWVPEYICRVSFRPLRHTQIHRNICRPRSCTSLEQTRCVSEICQSICADYLRCFGSRG